MTTQNSKTHSQWNLLKSEKFLPLFITQFLSAMNNNIYKNALIIMLTFGLIKNSENINLTLMINVAAGLFILPFLIFSAFAGNFADNNEKSSLIQKIKLIETITVLISIIGIYFGNIYLMFFSLFFLGTQAAFFGPLKYSILPQHLHQNELTGGNGLIESGTFIAILIGTILGGVLITLNNGVHYVSILLFVIAILGFIASKRIPIAMPTEKIKTNFLGSYSKTWKATREVDSVFKSVLAISWFWFLGATLLAQFPIVVKEYMKAPSTMVTCILAIFSIGIAIGSMWCEKLTKQKVEIGLVPFGAFGMTIFIYMFGFFLNKIHVDVINNNFINNVHLFAWFQYDNFLYMVSSLFLLAIFGGFYTVPLYAFIQYRTKEENRSKVIAGNNIINSLFMIGSALFAILLTNFGFSLINLIYALVILNLLVSIYIFKTVPEFLMRFVVWILINTTYRIKAKNLELIKEDGAAIITSNHVSFMDALFIFGLCPRPVKFVMYYKIFNIPFFKYMFNAVGAIPIASKKEDEKIFNEAFEKIDTYLSNGEIVVIFPEGAITHDGELQDFKPGILKVLDKNNVPLYPTALIGLWGSMFSRKDKSILRYFPKAFFNHKVKYVVEKPLLKNEITLEKLKQITQELINKN